MPTLQLSGNTIRMYVACHMVNILLRRELLQNHLIVNLAKLKSKVFTRRNTLLKQVKNYINNRLYPAKVTVTDPTKDN